VMPQGHVTSDLEGPENGPFFVDCSFSEYYINFCQLQTYKELRAAMTEPESVQLREQIEGIRAGIREVSHDLSNRVGVLRMAVYYLQATEPEQEKRAQYYRMMNESLDKAETGLRRLRSLVDLSPIAETPHPPTEDPPSGS
jgi:signal transduction histidine kinase